MPKGKGVRKAKNVQASVTKVQQTSAVPHNVQASLTKVKHNSRAYSAIKMLSALLPFSLVA
jgi:hypothetical protein